MHYTSINKESKAARKKRDGSILLADMGGKPLRTVDLIWVYIKNTAWQNICCEFVMAYACMCTH